MLSWSKPADADFAGVLILRREGARVDAVPTARESYAIGTNIGGATVIASTALDTWTDVTRTSAAHDYAFFAFDRENNYSAIARTPFVTAETLTWCPNEQGGFALTSEDAGAAVLEVDAVDFPSPAAPLNTVTPISVSALFPRSQRLTVRARAENEHGRSVGLARDFWVSPRTLALLPMLDVGAPASAAVAFSADGWDAFEAELDGDPGAGAPAFTGPTITATAPPVHVPVAAIGEYRVRVRPKRAGCADGDWTESTDFHAGRAFYVSPLGDDAVNSGLDAAHPVRTIGKAIQKATTPVTAPGTRVYVAAGSYPEQVTMKPGVSLQGGFDVAFSAADPSVNVTLVNPVPSVSAYGMSYAILADDLTIDNATVLEGFTVAPSGGTTDPHSAIWVHGARPLVRDNVVIAGASPLQSAGIGAGAGSGAIIEHNVVDGGDGPNSRFGIWIVSNGDVTVRDNTVTATRGIFVDFAHGAVTRNTVHYAGDNQDTDDREGIYLRPDGPMSCTGNTITPLAPTTLSTYGITVNSMLGGLRIEGNRIRSAASDLRSAVRVLQGNGVVIANNLLHGGDAPNPNPIYCGDGSAIITNNTIFVGLAGAGVRASNNCVVTVTNNLFFGDGQWWGMQREVAPASFHANAFLNEGAGNYPTIIVADPPPAHETPRTLDQSLARLCADGVPAEGNVEVNATRAQVFADDDWHLLAAAPSVLRLGGRDASLATCGGSASGTYPACVTASGPSGSCGSVTRAFDSSVPRTVPFSIGARERD